MEPTETAVAASISWCSSVKRDAHHGRRDIGFHQCKRPKYCPYFTTIIIDTGVYLPRVKPTAFRGGLAGLPLARLSDSKRLLDVGTFGSFKLWNSSQLTKQNVSEVSEPPISSTPQCHLILEVACSYQILHIRHRFRLLIGEQPMPVVDITSCAFNLFTLVRKTILY